MASWRNYQDKLKRYFPFSRTEWNNFLLIVAVFAFAFSFTQWGEVDFSYQEGLKNFVIALIVVGIVVFIHHAVQRMVGIWYGYRIEHKVWLFGLLLGIIAVLLTNGKALIFAASTFQAHFMPAHRIGAFRYGPSVRQIGSTAFSGNLVIVVLAFLFDVIAQTPLSSNFLTFSLLFAVYNMLPIPPLDGLLVFVGSKSPTGGGFIYKFTISAFLGFFLVYYLAGLGFLWSFLLAILIGFAGWIVLDLVGT